MSFYKKSFYNGNFYSKLARRGKFTSRRVGMPRTQPKGSYNNYNNDNYKRRSISPSDMVNKKLKMSEDNYQRAGPFVRALAYPVHAYEKWAITNSNKKGQSPFAQFILSKGSPLKKKRITKYKGA